VDKRTATFNPDKRFVSRKPGSLLSEVIWVLLPPMILFIPSNHVFVHNLKAILGRGASTLLQFTNQLANKIADTTYQLNCRKFALMLLHNVEQGFKEVLMLFSKWLNIRHLDFAKCSMTHAASSIITAHIQPLCSAAVLCRSFANSRG